MFSVSHPIDVAMAELNESFRAFGDRSFVEVMTMSQEDLDDEVDAIWGKVDHCDRLLKRILDDGDPYPSDIASLVEKYLWYRDGLADIAPSSVDHVWWVNKNSN